LLIDQRIPADEKHCGSEFIRDEMEQAIKLLRLDRPLANEFAPTGNDMALDPSYRPARDSRM
jgi:hypothetical protein